MQTDPKLVWKLNSSRYLSREPWFTARVDNVTLPTGKSIPDYYVLEYPDWVNIIAITKEKKIVMVQQYRHAAGKIFFEIPAGVCEKKDASPLESAKRELLEETGYSKGRWRLFTTLSANPGTHTNVAYTFLAEGVEKTADQSLDEGEAMTVHLFEQKQIFEMLQNGEFLQSLMAAPLWKFFYEKQIAAPKHITGNR